MAGAACSAHAPAASSAPAAASAASERVDRRYRKSTRPVMIRTFRRGAGFPDLPEAERTTPRVRAATGRTCHPQLVVPVLVGVALKSLAHAAALVEVFGGPRLATTLPTDRGTTCSPIVSPRRPTGLTLAPRHASWQQTRRPPRTTSEDAMSPVEIVALLALAGYAVYRQTPTERGHRGSPVQAGHHLRDRRHHRGRLHPARRSDRGAAAGRGPGAQRARRPGPRPLDPAVGPGRPGLFPRALR